MKDADDRTAVILFNLGGPDSRETIRPFLFNFFMDANIIRVPLPLRFFLATLISFLRSRRQAGDSYELLGGRSPLLENTAAQATALEKTLGDGYRVFVCMRYWHPMADEVAEQVKAFDPREIILLPLYPQFSTSTTRSSFQSWRRAAAKIGLDVPMRGVCCYPDDRGFIDASADHILTVYAQAVDMAAAKGTKQPRLLLSAHGLPEDFIRDGDPYQWQCERTARAIIDALALPGLDWQICYQSRVGPKKWIGPSTDEAIAAAGLEQVPLLVYPHAFVNEHVETLVEIEIEYRHLATEAGVPFFLRVPTAAVHPAFIDGLAALVRSAQTASTPLLAAGRPICPPDFADCACRNL